MLFSVGDLVFNGGNFFLIPLARLISLDSTYIIRLPTKAASKSCYLNAFAAFPTARHVKNKTLFVSSSFMPCLIYSQVSSFNNYDVTQIPSLPMIFVVFCSWWHCRCCYYFITE